MVQVDFLAYALHASMHKQNALRITQGNNSTELVPSLFYSNTNVHLVDINVFAKFDEVPSLPVQDINQTVVDKVLQRAITLLTELAPSPYSIINDHLVDINPFTKFDEIPSFPVQVIKEKTNVAD